MASGRWRAVDLARLAGISVQQLRNYVDQEVLPPVGRTDGGYRVFTDAHARAVTVARQLAQGYGWPRTRTIMRSVHSGHIDAVLAALDHSHAESDRERTEIATVLRAFETVVSEPDVGAPRRAARIGDVADAIGVRTSALRVWERAGLLRPARERGTGYRIYDATELRTARVIAVLRRGAYPLSIVRTVVDEIRVSGSPDRVRAELAVREEQLRRRGLLRLRACAALHGYLEAVARDRAEAAQASIRQTRSVESGPAQASVRART